MDSASGNSAMEVDNADIGAVASSANVAVNSVQRKSTVWKWFTKINQDESVCKLCQKVFKCKRASTTSLKRHVECQHREVYVAVQQQEVPTRRDVTNVDENLVMLDSNSTRAKAITTAIALMIIRDCQPFCIVNDSGFKNLIKLLEPRYNLPSRITFSDTIIPTIYENEKKRIATILEKDIETTESFAFTTDGWTSRSNENYLSVTVHYMNSNFVIQNLTLKISNVTESHTGEHIHSFLKNTLREWNLHNEEFNIFFVTDNAANIVKAIRLNRTWERIPCFAHTLQLVIKDAIKPCSELVTLLTKCRRIVRYFHRSSAANQKLKREQLAQYPGRTPLKLIIDCETRWNSQYDMLNRLMNVRRALHTVLCEPRMPDAITSREWAEIEEYSTCLKLFKEATEIMTVENTPTLPRYIPTVYGIRDTLMNMLENDNPSSRFYFATSTDSLLVSMILDPRIKNRLLPIERKEQAKDILEKFANKYSKSSITNNAGVADENVGILVFLLLLLLLLLLMLLLFASRTETRRRADFGVATILNIIITIIHLFILSYYYNNG
ncbi:zinc finger BED domain-containing protein 4-like [Lasioglossum baleicum]|uniref:zinc finger BED domain-containing protein 4-like n=1 Tax=Lasioglossum baleicum TaxID=434251 RepID=UPI003FCEB6E9